MKHKKGENTMDRLEEARNYVCKINEDLTGREYGLIFRFEKAISELKQKHKEEIKKLEKIKIEVAHPGDWDMKTENEKQSEKIKEKDMTIFHYCQESFRMLKKLKQFKKIKVDQDLIVWVRDLRYSIKIWTLKDKNICERLLKQIEPKVKKHEKIKMILRREDYFSIKCPLYKKEVNKITCSKHGCDHYQRGIKNKEKIKCSYKYDKDKTNEKI